MSHAAPYKDARSREISDILSCRPHWLVRSGNIVLLAIVLVLVLLTRFIPYPEKMQVSGILQNGSANLYMNSEQAGAIKSGQKIKLKNSDGQSFEGTIGSAAPLSGSTDSTLVVIASGEKNYSGKFTATIITRPGSLFDKILGSLSPGMPVK